MSPGHPSPEGTQIEGLFCGPEKLPWSPTVVCTAWEPGVMPDLPWCPLGALIVVLYRQDALEDSPGVQMVMGCQPPHGVGGWVRGCSIILSILVSMPPSSADHGSVSWEGG